MRVLLVPNDGAMLVNLSLVYQLPTTPPSVRSVRLAQLLGAMLPILDTPHLSATARDRLLLAADTSVERVRAVLDSGDLTLSVSVPPDSVELASFIEADRLGFAVRSLSQATLVDAERRLARDGKARDELLDAWLDDALSASSAVLVRELPSESAGRATVAELERFMRSFLNPGNATLVIEGPLEPKAVLAAIWRTFGRLEGGRRLVPASARAPSGSLAQLTFVADDRAPGASEPRRRPAFVLSWQSAECATSWACPLGVFSEWLTTSLGSSSRAWCTRVWAHQSLRRARFTVGCEPSATFDAGHWASHVSKVLNDFGETSSAPYQLQLASDRYRARLFSALSLPEHKATQVARQIARGESPALPVAANATPPTATAIRDSVVRLLHRAARSEVHAWAPVSEPVARDTHPPKVSSPQEPIWYRPPKKTSARSVAFPSVSVSKPSANLVLRHLQQRDAPVSRVLLRGLLRGGDQDPATAMVALEALQLAGLGDALLADNLWENYAVRTSWGVTANAFSVEFMGISERIGPAAVAVSGALQAASDANQQLTRAKNAALLRLRTATQETLLDQLLFRVGSPFVARVDPKRFADFQTRIAEIGATQIKELWGAYAKHGEFAVSLLGSENSQEAASVAAAALPTSWARSAPRSRPPLSPPRVWILDQIPSGSEVEPKNVVDLEVIWPNRRSGAELRQALAVAAIAQAAKALGNLNTARPHNPTTQFILAHRSLPDSEVDSVAVSGIDANRLRTVLRELDGYFARLIDRVDFPQLSRLGVHDLQRRQLGRFASPWRTLGLLDEWSVSGSLVWYPLDSYQNLGRVSRDSLLAWARDLRLGRATIIARGPAAEIESELRAVNRGEVVVVSP